MQSLFSQVGIRTCIEKYSIRIIFFEFTNIYLDQTTPETIKIGELSMMNIMKEINFISAGIDNILHARFYNSSYMFFLIIDFLGHSVNQYFLLWET